MIAYILYPPGASKALPAMGYLPLVDYTVNDSNAGARIWWISSEKTPPTVEEVQAEIDKFPANTRHAKINEHVLTSIYQFIKNEKRDFRRFGAAIFMTIKHNKLEIPPELEAFFAQAESANDKIEALIAVGNEIQADDSVALEDIDKDPRWSV